MKPLPILDITKFLGSTESGGFYSNNLRAHLQHHHQHIHLPHKHDSYLVVLFTKGSGTHEVDFNSYKIKPGSVFLLNPGQTHHWELSKDIDGYIFLHTRDFIDLYYSDKSVDSFPFFYSVQNTPVIYLKPGQDKIISTYFRDILAEYETNKVLKFQKLRSLLDVLYIDLSRLYVEGNYRKILRSDRYSSKLKELELLIDKQFASEKSPAAYAAQLHISSRHLNRIAQSLSGKTTSELIIERVMLEAKRMLIHSGNTITEIAELLGYPDYSYFSRLFKKHCGQSPSAFAKKYH